MEWCLWTGVCANETNIVLVGSPPPEVCPFAAPYGVCAFGHLFQFPCDESPFSAEWHFKYYLEGIHSYRYLWAMACKVCILSVRISVFWMPQIPFAFEFVCERPNDLCQIDIRLFRKFHFIFIENGWMAIWLDILKYKIFECEWMNGNSNDLCMAKW